MRLVPDSQSHRAIGFRDARHSGGLGFQASVAFISVPDLDAALGGAVTAGGRVERAPWSVPMAGRMARFADASGTVYGLLESATPGVVAVVPAPFGHNPRPPAGSICSVEMFAADGEIAAAFFRQQFGWGAAPTMPQYVMFDPGAGIGGVFQSHTPGTRGIAYIYSTNVRATIVAIEAAGGHAMGEPMTAPGMATFGYFTDPSGTPMGLIGP